MGLSDGSGATAVVELLQELVRGQKELTESHKELAASHKRMEARQDATERLLMEVVAQQTTMAQHLTALAEIVKSGFERVGQELVKVNARIDETNATLRLMRGATSGALEHDDTRIRLLEGRVQKLEERLEKQSA